MQEKDEGPSLNLQAKESSKEEEVFAICKLKGVDTSAPVSHHLKALDNEYHHLLDSGQSGKADHVQSLYVWYSKKVSQVRFTPLCLYFSFTSSWLWQTSFFLLFYDMWKQLPEYLYEIAHACLPVPDQFPAQVDQHDPLKSDLMHHAPEQGTSQALSDSAIVLHFDFKMCMISACYRLF